MSVPTNHPIDRLTGPGHILARPALVDEAPVHDEADPRRGRGDRGQGRGSVVERCDGVGDSALVDGHVGVDRVPEQGDPAGMNRSRGHVGGTKDADPDFDPWLSRQDGDAEYGGGPTSCELTRPDEQILYAAKTDSLELMNEVLTGHPPDEFDLNYQDGLGNCALHYA